MSYPAISLATATVGRHRCPQKRLQTARQPPVYPNSSPDHRACHSLTPFRCPHAVHPCPSVDSGLIDEVEVFNRALSQAEIKAIFLAGPEGKIKPEPEVLTSSNRHHYLAVTVPGGINWFDADAAARFLSFAGAQGHLATITSQQENDFIRVNFPSALKQFVGYWLGGFQPPGSPEPGGNWQWVTGEPFIFTNWNTGEPNNAGGTEDKLHFHTTAGQWNDISGNSTGQDGYVVEFEPAP